MKKFIVNADDFGLCEEVNKGIVQAFRDGIVTSVSLMATGEGYDDAVAWARKYPAMDVGIHLTLIEEKPVLHEKQIHSLIDDTGHFRKNIYQFYWDYICAKISLNEVEKEFDAQISKILKDGVNITHIDSHQHVHMIPGILNITIELAKKYEIKHIRFSKEKLLLRRFFENRDLARLFQQCILNIFCLYSKNKIRNYAVENFFGFYCGGRLSKQDLYFIVKEHREGVCEIMCHPGFSADTSNGNKYIHWKYQWEKELEILTDREILDMIKNEKVMLVSYSDIVKSQ